MSSKMTRFCHRCGTDTKYRIQGKKQEKICTICAGKNSTKHRQTHWFRYLAQKANARKSKAVAPLTEEDLLGVWKYQEQKCALTGVTLDPTDRWWKPSLDRIDSSRGYSKDNIRIVAWVVNHCRGSLTDGDFINMCNRVAENYTKYPYHLTTLYED